MKLSERGPKAADVLSPRRVWDIDVLRDLEGGVRAPLRILAVWFFLNRYADPRAYGFIAGVHDVVGRKDEGEERGE